jgi:small subunit ribosomal protein S6
MVLLHPDLEIDAETPINKIEGLVTAAGGKVTKRDNWGKKRLAYRIAGQDFAIYVYFELQLDPGKGRELESTISITEEVLRHILVVHEESRVPADSKRTDSDKDEADKGESEEEDQEVTAKEGTK